MKSEITEREENIENMYLMVHKAFLKSKENNNKWENVINAQEK